MFSGNPVKPAMGKKVGFLALTRAGFPDF